MDGIPVAVAGSSDGAVWVWDLATGQPRSAPLTGHDGMVNSLAVGQSDGSSIVLSGDDDGTVRLWDLTTGKPRGVLLTTSHYGQIRPAAVGHANGLSGAIWRAPGYARG